MSKREDKPFNTESLDLTAEKIAELKQEIVAADWDDLVTLEKKLSYYQEKLDNGERYEPRF